MLLGRELDTETEDVVVVRFTVDPPFTLTLTVFPAAVVTDTLIV
jgi:hypothetical protein